jgi:hypothetical protein
LRGHGGDISLVKTNPDGTVFRLVLPIAVGIRDRASTPAARA